MSSKGPPRVFEAKPEILNWMLLKTGGLPCCWSFVLRRCTFLPPSALPFSQNHKITQVGKDIQDHLVRPPNLFVLRPKLNFLFPFYFSQPCNVARSSIIPVSFFTRRLRAAPGPAPCPSDAHIHPTHVTNQSPHLTSAAAFWPLSPSEPPVLIRKQPRTQPWMRKAQTDAQSCSAIKLLVHQQSCFVITMHCVNRKHN